jgi:hypothetical protein
MKPRLIILIVAAAGLAVYFATRAAAPPKEETTLSDGISDAERQRIRDMQTPLAARDLLGDEPAEPADLSIRVEVDPGSEKNRLYYHITEAHGYYVETFYIEFWYKPTPDTSADASPLFLTHHANEYLKANETLSSCIEIVPAELSRVGGDMGTTENWEAWVADYGRARTENPDPLPEIAKVAKCD